MEPPYLAGGRPWLADVLSALYPTMLLNLILPLPKALAVELALHVWAAAVFMYMFLRRGHLPHAAAFVGAATFAFGGFVMAHTLHVAMIRLLAWLPLVLLWAREIPHRPWVQTSSRLAMVVALSLLAGHLQIVLLGASFAALLTVYSAVATSGGVVQRLKRAMRALAILCLGLAFGGLVSGVVLIPAFEMAQLSFRAGGLPYEEATFMSVPRRQILMLILPNLFGTLANKRLRGRDQLLGDDQHRRNGLLRRRCARPRLRAIS